MHELIFYLVLRCHCEKSEYPGYKKLDNSPPAIQTQKVTIVLVISVHTSLIKNVSLL